MIKLQQNLFLKFSDLFETKTKICSSKKRNKAFESFLLLDLNTFAQNIHVNNLLQNKISTLNIAYICCY